MSAYLTTLIAFDAPLVLPLFAVLFMATCIIPKLDRSRNRDRIAVAVFVAAAYAVYLGWRIPALVANSSLSFSTAYGWGVVTLELLAIAEIALFLLIMSRTNNRSAEADRLERSLMSRPAEAWPTVDVLIPTYNEGPEVLERSILAAKAMHYENFSVWVCDDGRDRGWLRDMCSDLGVGYLTREDRCHAKAGNINASLARTSGDLVAIFDADFAPARNFLLRTVGFFDDPAIGLVQTPQHFFNRDPVQTNLSSLKEIPDEQRLFFDHMAPSRDAWGAAFCCGSGSIVRRSALNGIGGVPTSTITEDLLTSLAILRCGFRTLYLNERLAVGLAPENLDAYIVQRRRWCQGAIQGLFVKDGPLGPGLRIFDRLLYFPTGWLVQHPIRLAMLFVPAVYFLTGFTPFPGLTPEVFVLMVLPLMIAAGAGMMWFAPGCYVPFISTAVGAHIAVHIVPSAFHTLLKPWGLSFKVTPKGHAATSRRVDRRGMSLALSVGLATAVGMIVNGSSVHFEHDAATFNGIANVWGALNLVICFLIGLLSVDRLRPRQEERFETREPVLLRYQDGEEGTAELKDLSTTGALLKANRSFAFNETFTLSLFGLTDLQVKVCRIRDGFVGVSFDRLADDDRRLILDRLHAGDLRSGVSGAQWGALLKRTIANFF